MYINFDNIHFTLSKQTDEFFSSNAELYEGSAFAEHFVGRNRQLTIENARTNIAHSINALSGELLFTSSLFETYETLFKLVLFLKIDQIITSETEDEQFLKMLRSFSEKYKIDIYWADYSKFGVLDLNSLSNVLKQSQKAFVFLSHVTIFSGFLVPVKKIARLCQKHQAFFALNCINSLPTMPINVKQIAVDAAIFASDTIHAQSGIYGLFLRSSLISDSLFEKQFAIGKRQMGTSNLQAIRSFQLAIERLETERPQTARHLIATKHYFISKIEFFEPTISVLFTENETSISNLLVLSFPFSNYWLHRFDMEGIAVFILPTQGKIYHELADRSLVCVSFSKYTTTKEIDYFVEVLHKFKANYFL